MKEVLKNIKILINEKYTKTNGECKTDSIFFLFANNADDFTHELNELW